MRRARATPVSIGFGDPSVGKSAGPNAYADLQARHRKLLREAVSLHEGVEVDTQGDGSFFAFPDAAGAVHAAVDPVRANRLAARWQELQAPVPLDVIECWDRNVPRTIERYVIGMAREEIEVTVVMPRRDYPKFRQRLLHDRTSGTIQRTLGRYPHIDVALVPYVVRGSALTPSPDAEPIDSRSPAR
jgi:hypothetical protein